MNKIIGLFESYPQMVTLFREYTHYFMNEFYNDVISENKKLDLSDYRTIYSLYYPRTMNTIRPEYDNGDYRWLEIIDERRESFYNSIGDEFYRNLKLIHGDHIPKKIDHIKFVNIIYNFGLKGIVI